nr:hypothetical protein [Tanacetum cinerariifolium]
MMNDEVHSSNPQNTSPSKIDEPCEPSPRMDTYEQPLCVGSTFDSETLRKSNQMHQTFEKSSIEMTRKLDDMIELPKSQPKKTYKEDLECDLDMMEDKVDNLSPQSTPQVLSIFEHSFIMDDPNITMEEYIRLEEEKARRQGRTFDWQTAKYYKTEYYKNEYDSFTNHETEYPAIVFDDISDAAFSCEPTVGDRLSVYAGDDEEALFTIQAWKRLFERQFILVLGLHSEEEMVEPRFGAYWSVSERVILDKRDLRDYWIEISFDRDFLGPAPSYVYIRDPVRRLCHKMIACSISSRGQEAEKVTGVDHFYFRTMDRRTANVPYLLAQYLFHHDEGRNSGARLSGGHFIGRLVTHFGLAGDQGLRGLLVIVRELSVIDLHELGKLNICARFSDTWAWVASRPKRQ